MSGFVVSENTIIVIMVVVVVVVVVASWHGMLHWIIILDWALYCQSWFMSIHLVLQFHHTGDNFLVQSSVAYDHCLDIHSQEPISVHAHVRGTQLRDMSVHSTDSHWHVAIAIRPNDHFVQRSHTLFHSKDNVWIDTIAAFQNGHSMQRWCKYLRPRDSYSHTPIARHGNIRSELLLHKSCYLLDTLWQ
jgi:hypothetical protein